MNIKTEKRLFEENFAVQLQKWDRKITEIKSQTKLVSPLNLLEFERQVDLLDAKFDLAREKLSKLTMIDDGAWDELKASIDGISNEIENAIDSAMAKIE